MRIMAPFKYYQNIAALLLTPAYEVKTGDSNPLMALMWDILPKPTL
ncbi:MAG: hypothetical protein H0A76_09975 [Candidatus Thiodubiliella endoseptemdiera]|uniref:Uncharacterized protein n=1 Tax=Candidatus Thiodubiliella endoseptemdiera TaxID=2738886 RepID=A0A853F2L9_9GAMM|nr:hypothetical protein [Candidatus Thiodubiliella endoseptemdiera]